MKAPSSTKNKTPFENGTRLGLRPPTPLSAWQWAAQNVRIQNSERSSKFDPEQTPWWKGPMECASDIDTREVVVLAPTGSGKSTMAEALIPYVIAEDPGAMLYASQTDEDAKFWAESRLLPTLRTCVALAGLWPEDRHKSRKMEIIFPHMPLILGGANLSNFQEKSVRWLYGDEVWTWKSGLVREFLARHHDRWNRKVFLVSQGGEVDGELDLEWRKTDQAKFGWRCNCGHEQAYSFESLRYDRIERDDGTLDEQATADTARMECVACRTSYTDSATTRRRLSISNMGNGSLGYIPTSESGLRGYRGFHVDSLAVWWIPWASEVLGLLEAQRMLKAGITDKLRQWRQKRRAGFWSEDMADSQSTIPRSSDFSKEDYTAGQKVEGEAMRFATVDVGGDHFWCIIAAWKKGGESRILWEGYIPSDGNNTKENSMAAKFQTYGIEPAHVFIDTQFEQDRIFDLCAANGWTGIKGEGKKRSFRHGNIERPYSTIQRARAKSGGIIRYVFLATNPLKDIVHRLVTGQGAEMELPGDLSRVFENHMKSERREIIKDGRTGQESSIWVTRHRQNHLWDCLVYQVGAALIFGLFDE